MAGKNVSPNALVWLSLSTLLIALDQWTKAIAMARLIPEQPVAFIAGFWNWNLHFNPGAAFSLFADAGPWKHGFFLLLAGGISIGLAFALRRTARGDWRNALPFALVIAGALGNVIDRLRVGVVIDFIDWYWRGHHWPVFNVADSCIVGGVLVLLFFGLREERKDKAA